MYCKAALLSYLQIKYNDIYHTCPRSAVCLPTPLSNLLKSHYITCTTTSNCFQQSYNLVFFHPLNCQVHWAHVKGNVLVMPGGPAWHRVINQIFKEVYQGLHWHKNPDKTDFAFGYSCAIYNYRAL